MASKGRIILCTIHQPSSELFSMFDQLGYPCPTNYNPADHFILTLAIVPEHEEESKKRTQAICDKFCKTDEYMDMVRQTEELGQNARLGKNDPLVRDRSLAKNDVICFLYEVSWLTQFKCLFWRSWISMFRDVNLTRVRFMQALCLSICLGLIYLQQTVDQKGIMSLNGAIFLLITHTSFCNIFAVVNSFPVEMNIFLREYGSGLYRVDTYYVSKSIAEVPLFIVVSVLFNTITYWMIGLHNSWEAFLIANGALILVATNAISLGYFVSTICGSVTVSLAVAPPLLIPFMLFGGLFVNNANIPVYFVWLEYLSWFKFSNEILMVNQWREISEIPCPNVTLPQLATNVTSPGFPNFPQCLFKSGQDVLDYTSFSEIQLHKFTPFCCSIIDNVQRMCTPFCCGIIDNVHSVGVSL
ncbi:hypothetical protein Btru_028360 [Bulinus truncatus]|nr:hypothetical protein Btru_028360 [Bulinus truncatus]